MHFVKLDRIGNLKLKEIEIFYLSAKTKSIREVARQTSSTPGQISKIIQSVEKKLDATLFKRSASGIVLSESGSELVQISESILDSAYQLESRRLKSDKRTLTVAATPFLINHLVSIASARALERQEKYSLRLLDIRPDEIVRLGLRGAFDVVLHFNKMDWPQSWVSEKIGAMDWVLCARQNHPLKQKATLETILKNPFIVPMYWTNEGIVRGNDFFEVPMAKRTPGYETSTADAAVPLLLRTDHIACLPHILIQPFLRRGELRIIHSPKLKGTSRDLFMSVKADALTSQLYERLRSQVLKVLESSQKA